MAGQRSALPVPSRIKRRVSKPSNITAPQSSGITKNRATQTPARLSPRTRKGTSGRSPPNSPSFMSPTLSSVQHTRSQTSTYTNKTTHQPAASGQVPSSPPSLYTSAHVAEPCITASLIHTIAPCSHKVITPAPEPCAANCFPSSHRYANPRTAEPFVCASCALATVEADYKAKVFVFQSHCATHARTNGALPPGWEDERRARLQKVWMLQASSELRKLEREGRACGAVYLEPESRAFLEQVTAFRASEWSAAPGNWTAAEDRVKTPTKAMVGGSRLPTPASTPRKNVDGSRLPMPAFTPKKR
ncbi:hypothetical protein B0A48_09839 [Cryoendolithus antarcticus]|uniref:Uncharacterized protein n=1 Tax=Cryoendolithus antarcticus TaxID=1507870 RepID=A0A1V8T2V0_9PEZI|nr:hypothetical protein B0A48_09839 [Cryoendolithus antarcticus]